MAVNSIGGAGFALGLDSMTQSAARSRTSGTEDALFERLLKQNLADADKTALQPVSDTKRTDSKSIDFSNKALIDKTDKLYEQCLSLETFVLKTLVNGMRQTVTKSGLIDTGFAGQMYEDMLYDEYTKVFAQNADFGLAQTAYLELTGQRGKQI